MAVQLKIRRLETGETLIAEFESLADAETWLRERPPNVDVLGTVGLDRDTGERLREATRPLDAGERARVAKLDAAAEAAARAALQREQEAAQAALAARFEEAKNADPGRLMHVAFERGVGCTNADPADPRPLPDVVVAAVQAWVAVRDEWVHPRGQYVATANLQVWPGSVPGGDEDGRIEPGGQFTALFGDPPQ